MYLRDTISNDVSINSYLRDLITTAHFWMNEEYIPHFKMQAIKVDKAPVEAYTKEGIFTVLYDSYNGRTRYYVWGYSDKTLCCDWQWEFVPQSTEDLPMIGSHVKVTGTLVKNENALDGYWSEESTVQTVTNFVSMYGDYDLTTMSPTLARVQIMNMINHTSEYSGKTVKVYGRVMQGSMIQHPYYDNAWSLPLEYDKLIPSIGTYITVTGTFSGTSYDNSKIVVRDIELD